MRNYQPFYHELHERSWNLDILEGTLFESFSGQKIYNKVVIHVGNEVSSLISLTDLELLIKQFSVAPVTENSNQ